MVCPRGQETYLDLARRPENTLKFGLRAGSLKTLTLLDPISFHE